MTVARKPSLWASALLIGALAATTFAASPVQAADPSQGGAKWCQGVRIRFFVGGDPGDAFASIVYKGAQQAEADFGPKVEYVFSGWQTEKMLAQLRDAIASKPDGIAMMGHAGDDAIMPLAEQAAKAGIIMMYQNVDVPKVRAKFGGGYVGANLYPQGRALGEEAIRTLGLKKGDTALVFGAWGQPGRYIREQGTTDALIKAGMKVITVAGQPAAATDPGLLIPQITGAFGKNPEIKLIVYSGGQTLGAAPTYMRAINKKPGEVFNIGFDTSPAIIDAFDKGFVQLTSDQQPFLQGYVPIQSICLTKKFGFAPMNVDTGAGFVNAQNYKSVADLAKKGLR
ncbi:MAG: sugar ABC transporter substrate-binding protein [Candidatus Thermofonsia Clade 3 bacterium]|jgi:simple sugar transport system substrate-binding protein|uniref:Sugar ABC transporter substrate-binding protein n=1 Tax=Candidatus Thermofonsia Clade 3 bacterium TaxID=2364212 RepID=A0A2M8Q9R3_9CHLR|nr:substrate-binding domain-containing protein [Candidatus Roseilinea sp. NK_OTU-006]PJF46537.1 MAG: sugar ABC transporter substrate-binding protein [Candidatus Thermofonsia Clade 3 bacterium]